MATLQQRAEQIRDEVQEAANTAQRVGQLLIDLIALIKGADSRYLSGIRQIGRASCRERVFRAV